MQNLSVRSLVWQGAFVACALAVTPASAVVLVDNLSEPIRDVTTVDASLWAAQSFSTDAQAYTLDSIEVLLGSRSGDALVIAQLRADAAGLPGAALVSFSPAAGTSPPSAGAPSLLPGAGLSLAANGIYWVVFGTDTDGSFGWAYAEGNNASGVGALGNYAYSADQGATWSAANSDNPYNLRVTVSAVPELPIAMTLFAGMLALTMLRRL